MGKLAQGFGEWVSAMNKPASSVKAKALRDRAIQRAFDKITQAWVERKSWDKTDRLAWEILSAFDQSKQGS